MTEFQEESAGESGPASEATAHSVVPATLPSRKLSIPAKRLAGSPACLNCGTALAGPFCHYCGQPDKNLLRFFPVLLRELLADFLDFDSRFARTMKPLLFHPGKLTRDYLDGRRFRYTPPLRLYIFASMAFFLIAAMLASSAVTSRGNGEIFKLGSSGVSVQIDKELDAAVDAGEMTEAEAAEISEQVKAGLGKTNSEASTETPAKPSADGADTQTTVEAGMEIDTDDVININGKPWNRETNPFIVPFASDFINDWINDEIEESPEKGREIEANPNIIVDKIMDVLPIAVFIMLPLVALLLKFWYLFSGHYYIEHLIHALHNHAFLFVIFTMAILADAIAGIVEPETEGLWTEAAGWFDAILLVWMPLYLLLSLRKVYQQGWFLTFLKFSLVGVSYTVLLALVTAGAALAGFVLL